MSIQQTGLNVSLAATHACDVQESTTVRRKTRSEHVNQSAALDWTFGALGAGLAASGAVILVDASNVYPNDSSARQYNPLGPTGARVLGASLAAAGAALATIAIVDVVRASGEVETVGAATVPGNVVERGVLCVHHPLAEAVVALQLGTEKRLVSVGTTGPDGKLEFDLDNLIPANMPFAPRDSVQVIVASEPAGAVTLDGLYAAREASAWHLVSTDACAKPKTSSACDAVRFFLMQYSEGLHATEARQLLAGSAATIEQLKSEEAWKELDSMGCTGLDDRDADQVAMACGGIKDYLAQFPSSQHSAAASEMLRKGASVEQRRRAEAARKAKEQADRERIEAEHAQARTRECVQRKCTAICQVRCPYSSSCLQGCIELCTSSDSVGFDCGGGR